MSCGPPDPQVHADCDEAVAQRPDAAVTATKGSMGHSAPPRPTRSWPRPCRSALRDVCRQHEQLRCRRPVSRAKMGAVAASSVDFTDGMIDRHKNYSRHHHSPLRTGRTPTASDPLSNSTVQETSLGPTTAGKNLQTNSPAAQSTVLDVLGSPHQRSSPDRTVVYGYGAPMEPGRWTQP